MNEKTSLEIAELESKKLDKSGFLLGPLHELIFSIATDIKGFGFEHYKFLSSHEINKYRSMLQHFQVRLKDSTESGKSFKLEIAEKMYAVTKIF